MKMLILSLILAVFAAPAQEQKAGTKKELRPFKPPQYSLLNPVLARDEACARDFAKGAKLDGIEQRKYLADLLQFGCVQQLEGVYYTNIVGLQHYGEGANRIELRKVHLIGAITAEAKDGWIISTQLYDAELVNQLWEAALARKRAEK